ncbi:MAG: copper resistance protein B, partial [Dokdonella sp.]
DHSDDVPLEPIPEVSDADRAAAFPHLVPHHMADNAVHSYLQLSRLETWKADAGGALAWQGSGWIGTDLNRVWLRSEGERIDGRTGHAELEVLYGRSVAPWWDVVVGVRQDFRPGPSQTWAGFGVQGLAPYKFEVQATAYVGESGQTAARFEIDYETLITNRLILQPFIEANFFGQNDARRGVGSGLSTVEGGLRLRYEFHRQLAPYLGVVHERAFGGTADFRRGAGAGTNDSRVVVGLRTWF